MSEEQKVDEPIVEDDKDLEEDKKSEVEGQPKEDDFEKEKEVVPASKFNQALRKQRELEIEKRELEKKLEEVNANITPKKEDEDDDDSLFPDEDEPKEKKIDPALLIDEKLKPVLESINKNEKEKRKKDRESFFNAHPEYAENGEKFQGLLDELDKSINPNSDDSYYVQLEKAHRIFAADFVDASIENKKKELASDAASGGGETKALPKEEFTAEDKQMMKEYGYSEETMRIYKKKLESGSMRVSG